MKKILALVLVCLFTFQAAVFAADFKDMPNDWSTSALEAAVANGLLTGSGGYIKASDNMTRAEMATIMVRACGATREIDISGYTDVKADDWFYTSMARAVAMGAFTGSDNKLNPSNPITRQEAFLVLSRVFGLSAGATVDESVLDAFKDKDKIADWAKEGVASIVAKGYVAGNDGYINPLNNISRAEFAVVMDRLIKYYIDEPQESFPTDGNIMIRANGVNLSNLKTDKMVVIGDAVSDESITIENAELSDMLVVRGGKKISAGGTYDAIVVLLPGVTVSGGTNNIKRVYICPDSVFDVSSNFMGGFFE
ncbi:MAG: S-layer homology domain-containing protein [Clostridia bacterium]|nr:S-layer homology domain-containing protein [Clostridia bacterium]